MASSLMSIFLEFPPVFMPWTESRFSKNITPGVGVWTTEENKMAMLQVSYQLFLEGRIAMADNFVTVDRTAFDNRSKRVKPLTLTELLVTQLVRFTDDPRTGKIHAKTSDGGNDDLGIAFLFCPYVSVNDELFDVQSAYCEFLNTDSAIAFAGIGGCAPSRPTPASLSKATQK